MPARIALAFMQSGASVSGIFPRGNPLNKVSALKTKTHYGAAHPLRALRKAIMAAEFDLIVPCDDRVVGHLHQLYFESAQGVRRDEKMCALIQRSLGDPLGFSTVADRHDVLQVAARSGVQIAETASIKSRDEMRLWSQQFGFPAVIKVDGTWGGSGVRVVKTWAEAETAYGELVKPLSFGSAVTHASFHNFYPLFSNKKAIGRVTIQQYIEGSLANAMFACWEGEVLGALSVEVLYSHEELGASTVVRVSTNEVMERAGRTLAKELSLSGFFGLDFVLKSDSGMPYLIELNPRATQLGHLEPSGWRSLVQLLYDHLMKVSVTQELQTGGQTIAFFPQSLQCDSENPLLADADIHHDVPWDEPSLVKELKRRPWNDRRLSALAYQAFGKVRKAVRGKGSRRSIKHFTLGQRRPED